MNFPLRGIKASAFAVCFSALALACASPPSPSIESSAPDRAAKTTKPLGDLLETQSAKASALGPKPLTITQSESDLKKTRVKGPKLSLSAQDADIKTLLMGLSKQIKQNIIVAPDIEKKATVDLKNVTLEEALDHILKPLHLRYTMDADAIRVTREQMETRMFRLNYIISRRQGYSSLQASRGSISGSGTSGSSNPCTPTVGASALGSTGSGSGAGAGGGQGTSSSVFSCDDADFWREMETGVQQVLGIIAQMPATPGTPGAIASAPSTVSAASTTAVNTSYLRRVDPSSPQERGFYTLNRQAGLIVVRDFPDMLLKVAEFIEAIEGSVQRQVFIQAKVIEVSLNKNYQLGIDWTKVSPVNIINNDLTGAFSPQGTFIQGLAGLTVGMSKTNLNFVVDALSKQGEIKVLSSPKIATLNNQRAVIKVGTEDVFFNSVLTAGTATSAPIQTTTSFQVTLGLVMDVLPQINADGNVMMSINTSISERGGTRVSPDGRASAPIVDVRESNNVVLARNGQTIIIGGLMKDKTETKTDGVPFLEDIPYLGKVFQKQTRTSDKVELVIMLTPEIMAGVAIDEKTQMEKSNIKSFGYPADERTLYQSLY